MSIEMTKLITRIRKAKHPEMFEDGSGEDEKERVEDGVELPAPGSYDPSMVSEGVKENEKLTDVDESYPLIPEDPEVGDTVYAWAHIKWDNRAGELVYDVIEPDMDEETSVILQEIRNILERTFDIDFNEIDSGEAEEYLSDKIDMIVEKYNISLTEKQREVIRYYTYRDLAGLGKLQPVMNDKEIEDISCDGTDIPVYVYHRNPKYGSIKTDITWSEEDELESFVMKLAQRTGRSLSVSSPLLDGALPDGSRVNASLTEDVTAHGPTFSIRKFQETPFSAVNMMNLGTANAELMAYMWILEQYQQSYLICGGTATGKTSFLNSVISFIPPEDKIVSIEDTRELRLPHENWIPS
ncbi:MAG: hypothetical protein BRC26_02655, partial [Nanohaloarchaea archaeon QH_8_44_6]